MRTEEETIQEAINDLNRGKEIGQKMVYDKNAKSIRIKSALDDPDNVIEFTPEMMKFGSESKSDTCSIVMSGEILKKLGKKAGVFHVFFQSWDKGDVYSLLTENQQVNSVSGSIVFSSSEASVLENIGKTEDVVRVIVRKNLHLKNSESLTENWLSNVFGYIKNDTKWKPAKVTIIPVKEELYSRNTGIIESSKLSDKRVALIGLGSVGGRIGRELVNSGIGHLFLFDNDRYEVGNISRHIAGITHVGRKKTNILKQLFEEINPYVNIETFDQELGWKNFEKFRDIFTNIDLVICTTGEADSMLVTNRLCVENNTKCIFAGALPRAYAVQIIRVVPHKSLCYQCFRMLMPEQAVEHEISNSTRAEEIAYSDKPVPIEPGLSIDIAPVSSMVVKLAIQELIRGSETTLTSLDDDLVASWYLWINRREPETQYENIEPLEYNLNGFHILRWYGIDIEPHPECPVCGNFAERLAKRAGVSFH